MSVVPSAALQFFCGVTACGCKVSTKSGVVASSASLQRAVVDEFKRMDLPVRASEAMKDLGVASTAGRRRCAWKVRLRRRTAFRRARELQYLAKLCGRSRKLFKPGVLSVGTWSHRVLGLPVSEVQSFRASAAK
eukprot:7950194-Pyramimonas_sp.AAC.1